MRSIIHNLRSNNASNCPKKLLHIDFDGLTIGTPTRSGSDTNWLSTVTGTNVRGYSFPSSVVSAFGSGSSLYVQSIPEGGITTGDLATFEAKFTNVIQNRTFPVYGSLGGKELSLACDVRDTIGLGGQTFTNPQTDLVVNIGTAAGLASPLREYYIRMDCFVPAGLTTQTGDTGSGNFWLFIDIKTGGYNNLNGVGDFRHIVSITNNGGVDAYTAIMDDEANGRGIIPGLSVGGVPGTPLPKTTFLQIQSPATVRTGVKHVIHMYVKYPVGGRSDTTTGIYTVVIEPEGYDPIVVCDVHGEGYIMAGVESLPPLRFHYLNYTSALLPNPIIIGNIEMWDSPSLSVGFIDALNHGPLPWVPTPLSKATYYVSPTGVSGNPGTLGSPKDIQSAVNLTVPGDVIFMLAGTYSVTTADHLNLWKDGTALKPIIYEAYPGHTVIIDGSSITPGVGNQNHVQMSGTYQKLRGVKVRNFPEYGVYIGGNYNTVDGCEISYNKLSGVIAYVAGAGPWSGASYNTIINNHIHHNSDVGLFGGNYNDGGNADGIGSMRGQSNLIAHNLVEYNSDDGIDAWTSWGTIIKYNISRYNGLGAGNGNGIKAGGNSTGKNAVVNNNSCYGNLNVGIDYNTGINVTMRNNTTYLNATGYGLGTDTINIRNVSNSDTAVKFGTGIATRNSWDITGTLTFISTVEGNANFLKVTQDGTFDGIGKDYV